MDEQFEDQSRELRKQNTDETAPVTEDGTTPKKSPRKRRWLKRILLALLAVFLVFAGTVCVFLFTYYHADAVAQEAMKSDDYVAISETDYGWYFNGPGKDDVLIFYPGARVEETAYAPLLRALAEGGLDVCLVKMPVHLAIFGANKAEDVRELYDYSNWYIGGHSMGGAMAARFAARHEGSVKGLVLLAAFTVDQLPEDLKVLLVYGSNDSVLKMDDYKKGLEKCPKDTKEFVIAGGNHAQFGNYGEQRKDGTADLSAREQQELAVQYILSNLINTK